MLWKESACPLKVFRLVGSSSLCLEEKDCRLVGATLKVAKVDRCLYLTEEKPPGLTKVLKTITHKYHMKVHGVALHWRT